MIRIYSQCDVFYPADLDLGVGDVIDVVLVAGGNSYGQTINQGGQVGKNSSFGSYAIAYGGKGYLGGANLVNGTVGYSCGGGGGGGFIPGAPFQGGTGLSGKAAVSAYTPTVVAANTNGGGFSSQFQGVIGGNGGYFGGGNSYGTGEGGAGYGAGGGAPASSNTNQYGGNSGQMVYYSHILTSSDIANGIPLTIGSGGQNSSEAQYYPYVVAESSTSYAQSNAISDFGKVIADYRLAAITFSLADGTVGVAEGYQYSTTQTGNIPNLTTHVKIAGTSRYVAFDTAFPGNFGSSFLYPMYFCNGYYVQCQSTASGTLISAWPQAKVKDGTIVIGDRLTATYGTTYTPIGFNATDMIMWVSQTSIRTYVNWTPASTTFTNVTLASSLSVWNTDGSTTTSATPNQYCYFIPVTTTFIPVTVIQSTSDTVAFANIAVITNYLTGAVSASVGVARKIMFYTGSSGYVICSRFWNGQHNYFLPTHYGTDVQYGNSVATYVAKGNNASALGISESVHSYPKMYIHIGEKGFATGQFKTTSYYTSTWGYNNVVGHPNGGGAGGCCMITW